MIRPSPSQSHPYFPLAFLALLCLPYSPLFHHPFFHHPFFHHPFFHHPFFHHPFFHHRFFHHPTFQAYDASISFLASLLHVNSSCASLPASSRPSLTWTRPTNPTPSSLVPHTTSTSSDSPSSHTPHTPHSPHTPQLSSLPDAEAAAVGAAVGAAVAAAQNPPWECVPELPAVDWPQLRWRFDWPTFTIHATSDRKPLAVRAWTGRTIQGSKRRDFRFIVKQGLTGCTVPFKSASDSYIGKFGTLCLQPIPFVLHAVSPPALQPDGLWYFNSSIRDIPK
ncbi:unnamed protein product, partial [Closterium sp. Naga37s-1]